MVSDPIKFFTPQFKCLDCDNERTHICMEDHMSSEELSKISNHHYLMDIFISEEDIRKIMEKMPLTNTGGPDGIPSILLSKCSKSLSLPVTLLWRTSFENGREPTRLKLSLIFPQLKDGALKTAPKS